ncbi:MAG: formylmethanofuran dehydrogenase subunit E family protein [Candidatus Omnitrophica bacterium]|nr:formylmethanofuran dehydrogenase subunit E family protein [Candidatus Omnitrophota bacterium]
MKVISLKKAVEFHGHLGPYLVLGILAGSLALRKLNCRKHFGILVTVWGATQKPKSCLIDGLQLSTGATFGKGNIEKKVARYIRIRCINKKTNEEIVLRLTKEVIKKLAALTGHRDSEALAKQLYSINPRQLFEMEN